MNIKTFLECNVKEIISLDNVLIHDVWSYVKETQFSPLHGVSGAGRKHTLLSSSPSCFHPKSQDCVVDHQHKCRGRSRVPHICI